ncbi:MAG: sulfatase-like hydrolase/transferase [Lentisphaerae bacterium]|jgi:arylsulfatase A-like enzyme|nr:sulfatase-like hydrolase/transferase [Lentisphaerota bacterium]MBT5611079.1 sulfatase-like hydrolase/transferase [Lentisphaerota bacterium]MBT7055334.1 sulfatase-like hydrolase/transferase [Lentisphaerota bacterium]MBT7840535.1 sulfatase-like hydrolase/transferase [Lentisphaerota bacterium]
MPEDRPNILLVFTDQHRLSAVGAYGETPCCTPNLDRLAAEGVRFATAYTTCPVCSPARGTVMTGLYPHRHGITSNVHNLGCSVHELPDRPDLLSRRLRTAGYRCGYSGKWHLGENRTQVFGAPSSPTLPRDVGFDGQNFPGHGGGGFKYPEYQQYLAHHGWEHAVDGWDRVWPCGILRGPEESTVPYFLTENSLRLMDRYRAGPSPFFIWHNFWGPHGPYFVPREYYDMYRDVDIPPWPNYAWDSTVNLPLQVKRHPDADAFSWDDWAEAVRYYYAFTTLIDRQIGRLLEGLDQRGLAENTIVIFTADHGETLGSHGGLTDKGWHHFEEIQRVPFIVRTPRTGPYAGLDPGTVMSQWVSLVDLYPTLCELAGCADDAPPVHGRSIVPLLRGEAIEWADEAVTEFHGVNSLATNMISIRVGDLKYGWNCANRDELYDLGRDPHEMTNVIEHSDYADALSRLRERLAEWMRETGHPSRGMYIQSRLGGMTFRPKQK